MQQTAADVLIEGLIAQGVEFVFGLPGDGINGILESLRKHQESIRFIQFRHEEAAALAAVGYAKFSGKLGVCLATTGPGAIHLLNGLYDAKLDQVPVLAITGLPFHDLIGTRYQQDVATDRLFADVAAFSERVMGPLHVKPVLDRALRVCMSRRTVAHVCIPADFQSRELSSDTPSEMNQPGHSAAEWRRATMVPRAEDLRQAAEILNAGKKIAIIAGSGARGAAIELEMVASLLGAPIAKALLGKDVLPDDSPFTTGSIGVLGTAASAEVLNTADTLLLVGTSFPYVSYLPKPNQARAVQIDINPDSIALRYPVEVGLVGDAVYTLRLLLPLLIRKQDQSFLARAQERMQQWWDVMEKRGMSRDMPMRPQVPVWELGKLLSDDAIVCADCGQNTFYAARHIKIRAGQRFSCSGLLATMGNAVPYAIGAQLAFPQRQVVVIAGDGGLTMTLGEFATCKKYNLPIKVLVLKNNSLGMIRWEQMMFMGNPEFGVDLQDIDFARVAEGFGWRAYTVTEADQAPSMLQDALECEGPVLVQAVVDGHEPLVPGEINEKQAEHYATALAKGQPDAERIVQTLFRSAWEDLEPNRSRIQEPLQEQVPGLAASNQK